MKKIFAGLFFIIGAVVFLVSCNDGIDYEKLRREELAILQEFIDQNYPDAEPTSSGLYYFNEEGTGSGDTIKPGDRVQVYYATWVLDKNSNDVLDSFLVDQSNSGYLDGHRYEPYTYIVGTSDPNYKTIAGLEEASLYMQPGTRSHLVINSELAYGQRGSGSVGMFQTLLMEVEVYKVIPFETPEE